mmetsp:Transcript_32572/g.49840  ORF Transcript_32572/g.49840 Transcript_32572/m.49840 type:complete len:201 (-) Transcript_32572:1428-2030(-)
MISMTPCKCSSGSFSIFSVRNSCSLRVRGFSSSTKGRGGGATSFAFGGSSFFFAGFRFSVVADFKGSASDDAENTESVSPHGATTPETSFSGGADGGFSRCSILCCISSTICISKLNSVRVTGPPPGGAAEIIVDFKPDIEAENSSAVSSRDFLVLPSSPLSGRFLLLSSLVFFLATFAASFSFLLSSASDGLFVLFRLS